jgi:hypothetical protein
MCSYCRRVRDDGHWVSLERYLFDHTTIRFTHGICPTCEASVRQSMSPRDDSDR